jgi:outer membrane receptor for monomeric catechols
MKHVSLKENFINWRVGTIFAVVEHCSVWMAGVNQTLPSWTSLTKYGRKVEVYEQTRFKR